jgi:hypothetical protein
MLTLILADYVTIDADGAEIDLTTLPDAAVERRLCRAYPTATAVTIADGVATVHLPDPAAARYADLAGDRLAQGRASLVMVETLRRLPTLADMTLLLAAAETELRVTQEVDWRSPAPQYTLASLPGRYTGLQLLALAHVLGKAVDAESDLVPELGWAYAIALAVGEG